MVVLMPTPADAPLRKVTLNLYEEDCIAFEKALGHGWTTRVRELMHHEAQLVSRQAPIMKRILGDLDAK